MKVSLCQNTVVLSYVVLLIFLVLIQTGCTAKHDRYALALQDAAVAEEYEIKPLVCLTKNDKRATFRQDKVLLASWHNVPQVYESGRTFVSDRDAIWAVSAKELNDKIKDDLKNKKDSEMPYIRLCQLLGRSNSHEPYTHVSYLLVSPKDVIRPAYQTDACVHKMTLEIDTDAPGEYKKWFEKNQKTADGYYPWTRLGYTCDWKEGACNYGLSEFIIKKGAVIEVEKTLTNDAFFNQF